MTRDITAIIGASVGGVRTAEALRGANYDGRIVLVGDEDALPYDKPPLSKGFLAGTASIDDIALLSQERADELGIELMLGYRATKLDAARHVVQFNNGERLHYRHLVIATGARAVPSPWGQIEGLHVLRTLGDAQGLGTAMKSGDHMIVIGGGFVGTETAATARTMGLAVTIIDPNPAPMARGLGAEIGKRFAELHKRNGVETLFGARVQSIDRSRNLCQVHLAGGWTIESNHVVVGIGAIPNDAWLVGSGVPADNGVMCDQFCRAIGVSDVFAVGDVARWKNLRRGRHTRVEHWTNAVDQASAVAHNIVHPDELTAYTPIEYVWSDQFDWKLRIAGLVGNGHVEIVTDRGHADRFAAVYSLCGRVLSGITVVNWPRALIAGRKALASDSPYSSIKETLQQLAGGQHPIVANL